MPFVACRLCAHALRVSSAQDPMRHVLLGGLGDVLSSEGISERMLVLGAFALGEQSLGVHTRMHS